MNRFICVAIFCCLPFAAVAADNPWPAMTEHDLHAIHDLLEANHPGPVDAENPKFRVWLNDGLKQSLAQAQAVRSLDDYQRTLLFYKNGFQDGHIGVRFNVQPTQLSWPGFVVDATTAEDAQVTFAETDAGVAKGAKLISCDGKTLDQLLAQYTDLYFWNTALPHQRYRWINKLFALDANDNQPRIASCIFSSGTVALNWRNGPAAVVQAGIDATAGLPKLGLREIDGVWLMSIPTFGFIAKADMPQIQNFIAEIKAKATTLRRATVVIDVRGNTGGNSGWGQQIAEAFWGKELTDHVSNSFDWTTDWRASQANADRLNSIIDFERSAGMDAKDVTDLRDKMTSALQRHEAFARDDEPPHATGPMPPNPVTGRVYFLTDRVCASACLDFADIVRRMPGVVQVGLPTYADSVYMDINSEPLPSGLAALSYGMKVYRNRIRKNNEWYDPQIRWPGGPMNDDEAIVRWIKSLR